MPRMITQTASSTSLESPTVADQSAIGCGRKYISFTLDNGSYFCDKEKAVAELILDRNICLWPAVVFLPTGIHPDLLYAQCSFKYAECHDFNYKEAGGINRFLAKGCVLEFMRDYSVASLIVVPRPLADGLYSLDEPRIEESLFVLDSNGRAVSYRGPQLSHPTSTGWSVVYNFGLTSSGAPFCGASGDDCQKTSPSILAALKTATYNTVDWPAVLEEHQRRSATNNSLNWRTAAQEKVIQKLMRERQLRVQARRSSLALELVQYWKSLQPRTRKLLVAVLGTLFFLCILKVLIS